MPEALTEKYKATTKPWFSCPYDIQPANGVGLYRHQRPYRHSVVPLYSGSIVSAGVKPAGKSDTLKYERLLLTKPSSVPVSL